MKDPSICLFIMDISGDLLSAAPKMVWAASIWDRSSVWIDLIAAEQLTVSAGAISKGIDVISFVGSNQQIVNEALRVKIERQVASAVASSLPQQCRDVSKRQFRVRKMPQKDVIWFH